MKSIHVSASRAYDVLIERGLLSREIHEENVRLRLCAVDGKVDLEQSPYWAALQGYIKGK